MNNDQIISWIAHNALIYLKPTLKQYLHTAQNAGSISHLLRRVMERLCEVMETHLKLKQAAILQDFGLFFAYLGGKDKNNKKIALGFAPIGRLKNRILTPFLHQGLQKGMQKIETDQLCKQIGSFLWMPQQVVKQAINIYSRAVGDLIGMGRQICLNWGFCKLRLSRTQFECGFSQKIIKYIAGQQGNKQNKAIQKAQVWLWSQNQDSRKIQEDQRHAKNWQSIKEGNLLDLPSLREIQNHLEAGYNLQLKYKQCQQ